MKKEKYLEYLDYLLPLGIWLLIFGKYIFRPFLLVDYVYPTFFTLFKDMQMSNYTAVISPFYIFMYVFSLLGLLKILFQLSILISMLVSFYYIKKTICNRSLFFGCSRMPHTEVCGSNILDIKKTFPERIKYILFSIIYFFNPFVYTRIMIGQIGILLAYLFIPAYLYYLLEFFKNDFSKKSLFKLVIAMTISSLFAIHFFVINFIIFLIASFWFYFYKNKFSLKKYLVYLMNFIFLLLLINAFWIQGYFTNPITSQINEMHEQFFSPKMSENIPAVAKIIGMWGFWRESVDITTYKEIPLYIWYPLLFILILLLVISWTNAESEEKRQKNFFFTLFWTGLILGVGISHPYISPIFDFLFKNLPLFNGLRDSHKFTTLIALSYAYFISSLVLNFKEKRKKYIYFVLVVFFILFFTYPLIGLKDQLKPVEYPKEYFALENYLQNKQISGYIIYLPFQNYFTYNWTINTFSDGRISVPINNILRENVLIGPDEYGGIDSLRQNIRLCLDNKNITCLENNNIQYIIKDKCAFFPENYSFLYNPVFEDSCISLYKLNTETKITNKIPLRFYIGTIISLITLIIIFFQYIKYKRNNKKV